MQDEIELLPLNSPSESSKSFLKKDNRIRSPPHIKVTGRGDGNQDITALFVAKAQKTSSIASTSRKHEKKSDTASETQETSQISDDVFMTDRKTSIDTPSKTDSKSYKDRIRNRFQTIKENAGKSSQKVSFQGVSKRLIMDRVRRETADIDHEIQNKRKNTEGKLGEQLKMYNFFVGDNGRTQESEKSGEEVEKCINESTEELIDSDETDDIVVFKYPQHLRFEERNAENEWIFRSVGNSVELSRKLVEQEARYLQEEGFFVSPKPEIPQRRINILEERLLGVDDKKWFNCEGQLDILENPITKFSQRPSEHLNVQENLTVFTKPILDMLECQEVLVIKENILHVNLNCIKFDHHPLFSLEHVLERQLVKTCEKYEKYMSNITLKKINNRLEATRHILLNLEKTSGDGRREKSLKYKKEIRELRETLFEQGKEERKLLKSALSLWKSIKKLRVQNGYSVTSTKLVINKENLDVEQERKNYEESLQRNYQEILSEHREDFKNKMRIYKKTLQELQKSPRSESDSTTVESPKKPVYNIDEDLVFKQLKARFEESFRSPTEPLLKLIITNENQITKDVENPQELARRNLVLSTKIHLKIVCNKLPVCKTKSTPLNDNFTCTFNENISILLSNIPKFIKVIVIERNTSQKRVLTEINLNVPNQNITCSNTKCSEEAFEKIEAIQYKHEGVGSGSRLKKELEKLDTQVHVEDVELNTSGTVFYTCFWKHAGHDRNVDKVEIDDVLEDVIDKNAVIHVDKLTEWIGRNKPDPQNPKNSVLYEYIQGFDESLSVLNRKKYFRLNPYQKGFEFCHISEIDDNIRMKILQLRDRNEPEFDGMVIPNRIREIPANILKDYKRRIAHEREGFFVDDEVEDDYDSKRKIGARNLKQIQTKVFQKCKSAVNNLEVEDVVDEKYLVHLEQLIRTFSTNFFNWFRWKPQISHPFPELKKSNVENVQTGNQEISSLVNITIKVTNGINIPERDAEVQKQNLDKDQNILKTVKPFVEIRYNDVFDRTSVAEGAQPVWNESLSLVLNPSHFDYLNPNSLSGNIVISVFDELEQNVQLKDVKTRNWLGCLEVPLSAICTSNGMAGCFKLHSPNVIFGYIKGNVESNSNLNITTGSYLNLQFSVHPSVPKLTPSIEELPCSDLPYIKDYIVKWNNSYNHSFPARKFSALAINSNGKTTCLVRYIVPLEPPQLNNEGFDVEPEQCAKFVSLVPFTNCNHFYQNIWLSTDQFLQFLSGSVIDHAVALTCFLLALKLDVWLLLGFGIPHGSTAYVLVREHSKETELPLHFIYDVASGEKISVTDAFCPLQRIYCLIGEHNIWANIQRNDNVFTTRFDLTRRSDWQPLFDGDLLAPTNSVHSPVVYLPRKKAEELEMLLERKIKKFISNSRPLNRTVWNKRISNIVKNNIHLLDYVYMHGRSNQEICNELKRNISDYDICGFILNLPYTNISSIMKRIKIAVFIFKNLQMLSFALLYNFRHNLVILLLFGYF
ncbi:hypothetical protein HHI36_019394 [Cryptolaemus montrouzieri]|uniref:C2 domain-containing protein n=1 Tax=Cryptolaemus montrouzieri TaxID=559131 RepID=A0ABD2P321_9CUCU